MTSRLTQAVLTAATLGVLLAGCGDGARQPASTAATAVASTVPAPSTAPSTAPAKVATAASAPTASAPSASAPSLPPGDPGLDAPAVPDPGTSGGEHGHAAPARRTVPREALLDEATVRSVLGASWREVAAEPLDCTRVPAGVVADLTTGFVDDEGALRQTVNTHADAAGADRAVGRLVAQLRACGWDIGPDPRLGSASATASWGAHTLTAVSAEGVTLVLTGSGTAATGNGSWSSLVDLAMGSVCPAAPDGCH
jgi:hypothetical protein